MVRVSPRKFMVLAAASMVALPSTALIGQASAAASGPAVPRAATASCGLFAPAVRPGQFILACADANALLIHVHWSEWGSLVAVATAEETVNSCQPTCAASKTWLTANAQVKLSLVVPTTSGYLFRTLSWREAASRACTKAGCATRWTAWQSEPLMVSKEYYASGAVCPSADTGLAANGYGSLVWCETIGTRHLWVHISWP